MKVTKTSNNNYRGQTFYEFMIEDAAGRTVWSGSGFVSSEYREQAIKIATRELTGQPPVIAGKHMTEGTKAILRGLSNERFGTHAG